MSGDIFGSAAAYAQKQRAAAEKQMHNGAPVSMENNALVDLLKQKQAEKAEADRRAMDWADKICKAFERVADAARACDRDVTSIAYNGEVVSIRRQDEAIRLMIGKIRNVRDLQMAATRVMSAIMGC